MAEVICIVCPQGCHIQATVAGDGQLQISGQGCRRGENYARAEITSPQRMLTGIVAAGSRLLPVRTARPIPKEKMLKAMQEIREIRTELPVRIGQIIREDLAGTGVALLATKNVS